jgi:hypothetical protein
MPPDTKAIMTRSNSPKRHLLAIFVAALLATSLTAWAQSNFASAWRPTAVEIIKLPKYCWPQFNPSYKSQGMASPVELCGVGMNHLCPGLVQINRAANPAYAKQDRKGALGQARIEIDYTLQRTSATCSIAQDVYAADSRIKALQQFLK